MTIETYGNICRYLKETKEHYNKIEMSNADSDTALVAKKVMPFICGLESKIIATKRYDDVDDVIREARLSATTTMFYESNQEGSYKRRYIESESRRLSLIIAENCFQLLTN